jgi:SsrA-binding protein
MAKEKISNNIQIKNKRATFDYALLETFTAGIVLTGTEIKSIRLGKASLVDTYCIVERGELWVKNMYIAEYFYGTYNNHAARRDRKLLLTHKELKKIDACQDAASRFLVFDAGFPYSQFKPRGHYIHSKKLSDYFKAMQWLQLAPYCREDKQQLKDAVFIASLLNTATTSNGESLLTLYKSIFEPVVFLIGEPDNLSVLDIANYLNKEKIDNINTALQSATLEKVNRMLISMAKTRNRIAPKVAESCKDKINFMPARYLMDNEIIQEMVDVTPSAEKAYPKGLDVFAALGSKPAWDVLLNTYKENELWGKYLPTLTSFRQKFENYRDWNVSVYNKWLEGLLSLQRADKSYPAFMQLPAWSYKNLNTALASWTDLKHDVILYGERPIAAECGGGGPPAPITVGYVEPNIQFWKKLDELITLTDRMLTQNKLMTEELQSRTDALKHYVKFLLAVSEKELRNEKLTESEYRSLQHFGASIENFTLSVVDVEVRPDMWRLVQGPSKSIAVVADIYTRNVPGCSKNGILHEAVGNANYIYVVVEIGGNLYLTRGAVFSYYEFVQPLNQRLTDEEWQKMLENGKAPSAPVWLENITIKNGEPKADERIFYSSGC